MTIKKELTYNEIFGLLEALKMVNIKGFKINCAIDKNTKAFSEEMKTFQGILEKEKSEEVKKAEEENNEEVLKEWKKQVDKFAYEKVEVDIYTVKEEFIPDDIDTNCYRAISLFIEE